MFTTNVSLVLMYGKDKSMGKIRVFESQVEEIKYKVMRELARQTWAGRDAFSAFN